MRKRIVAAAISAIGVVTMTAGPALAGEITGSGKPLWTNTDQWGVPHTLHGQSACAFSGQEDDLYGAGVNPDYNPDAFHAQSWGQIARYAGGALGGVPGTECNPTRATGGE
jgi:hypothetical protein